MTPAPVQVISLGGTIAMVGEPARPALSGEELASAVPGLDRRALHFTSAANLPGAHIGLAQALELARLVCRAATDGGVVVTQGTDTLEEMAFLCDLLWAGENPLVFTGAMRPASAASADGPANILDAVAVARSEEARGLGAAIVFAGEIHAARDVRKDHSTSLTPFASPHLGPLGHVHEGRVRIGARPERTPVLAPARLDARVQIAVVALGDDGAQIRQAIAAGVDGLVVALLGAGHGSPAVLRAVEEALENEIPTVLTCRPRTGFLLHETYGFTGAESDMRATAPSPRPPCPLPRHGWRSSHASGRGSTESTSAAPSRPSTCSALPARCGLTSPGHRHRLPCSRSQEGGRTWVVDTSLPTPAGSRSSAKRRGRSSPRSSSLWTRAGARRLR